MMASILILIVSLNSNLFAFQEKIQVSMDQLTVQGERSQGQNFSKINLQGFASSKIVGAPELPVKSYLFVGKPEQLNLSVKVVGQHLMANTLPFPVQPEKVRNKDVAPDEIFYFNDSLYQSKKPIFTTEYLGDYRGTPVTKAVVSMGHYDAAQRSVTLYTDIDVQTPAELFNFRSDATKTLLIVVPEELSSSIETYVQFKKSLGFEVFVETLQYPEITNDSIKTVVAEHFSNHGISFALFVGDGIPHLSAPTSGSSSTPSDLNYFTVGGDDDFIPDIHAGRITGSSHAEILDRLGKSMEYEQQTMADQDGWTRMIGIASDEGYGPSDNEYILSIEKSFADNFGLTTTHFYQSNPNSNPTELNRQLEIGASWLFYMGHGSGSSWPSMHKTYSVGHLSDLNNQEVVKPIIIDVACMNGRVQSGYLGHSFASILETTPAVGAVAYYGGTVNISWHPPAVMARGIAYKHAENKYEFLGEAILAGQLYLADNYSDKESIQDNFEWYVLQGDPTLAIH